MQIGSNYSTWSTQNAQQQSGAEKTKTFSRTQSTDTRWPYNDRAEISDTARGMLAASEIAPMDANSFKLHEPKSEDVVTGKGMRKYLNIGSGSGQAGLTAMNMNRKNLGGRIDSLIKSKGINLRSDEKLTISVDGKNNIVVGGIKDKEKAKAIQEALNDDLKLGRELRKHVASAKINEYAKQQKAYEKQMGQFGVNVADDLGEDTDDLFTNSGMRSLIIEEYLQENANISLSDLSVERGADGTVSILGMNSELNALLTEDAELGATIAHMLENGENSSTFKASFEFANGALSDSTTTDAAKDKIDGIKAFLMGGIDKETGELKPGMLDSVLETIRETEGVDEEFIKVLGRGFSIRVDSAGKFEILGLDDMDWHLKETLKNQVEKALEAWAGEDPQNRTNSFADVAQSLIEQHQFEHGDTGEYQHMVEINFSGSSADAKVVSPEADKAQDEANQKIAGELGEKLKGMLEKNDIDTSGLEMEIDEKGKITVIGDPANADVQRAQSLIDQFVTESKALGNAAANGTKPEETDEALAKERRNLQRGITEDEEEEAEDDAPIGFAAHDVVAKSVAREESEWSAFLQERSDAIMPFLPNSKRDANGEWIDPESKKIHDTYVNWQKVMPKHRQDAHFLGNVESVSNIRKPKYVAFYAGKTGEAGEVGVFGSNGKEDYDQEATALYLELMDGMTQFHDDRRKVSYSLSA